MSASPTHRRRRLALTLCSALSLVVAMAAPSFAGGAKSTSYAGTWVFDPGSVSAPASVSADLRSAQLTDYASTAYYDRVAATPGRGESVTVGELACEAGSYYESGLSVYAEPTDWANNVNVHPGRVRIACTVDGVLHHFHWGNYVKGSAASARNCVAVTVSETTERKTVTLAADDACEAQDRIMSRSGKVLSATTRAIPFTATLTFQR